MHFRLIHECFVAYHPTFIVYRWMTWTQKWCFVFSLISIFVEISWKMYGIGYLWSVIFFFFLLIPLSIFLFILKCRFCKRLFPGLEIQSLSDHSVQRRWLCFAIVILFQIFHFEDLLYILVITTTVVRNAYVQPFSLNNDRLESWSILE